MMLLIFIFCFVAAIQHVTYIAVCYKSASMYHFVNNYWLRVWCKECLGFDTMVAEEERGKMLYNQPTSSILVYILGFLINQ